MALAQYEIAILYDPDLEIDLEKATSRVEKIFADNGANIVSTDNQGKRKLAYAIKGNESAIYVYYIVEVEGTSLAKIEGILNITDEVIRFLIVKPDFKKIAKAEAEKADKAKKAAERGDRAGDDDEKDEDEKESPRSRR